MTPFHVQCQTCRTYLRVTKPEAIGLILGCPKCNGMVEVQPPPEWQDETGQVANPNAVASITNTIATESESIATGNRWLVPGIAGGALLCAGLLSWLVWSQLREPDRAEVLPLAGVAVPPTRDAEPQQPLHKENLASPDPASPRRDEVSASPTLPVTPVTPPTADNPLVPPAVVEAPPAVADTSAASAAPAPAGIEPPKPRLVLKPEEPVPGMPAAPLLPLGHEPAEAATQAKPASEPEEKSVFAAAEPGPVESPPAIAPVAAPKAMAAPLTRIPMPPVNAKQLELSLAAVSYEQVPLHAFLQEMSDLADTQLGVDDAVLFRNGWRLDTPVRVKLENVTVRSAIQAALRPLELDLVVRENYLWVTQAEAGEAAHVTRYPIDDLVTAASAEADAALLAAQVQRAVPPALWNGGKIEIVPGALLVTQTTAVHDYLIVWFEKLRVARGLPLRTKYDPANPLLRRYAPQRFAMLTRWEAVEPLLSKPVTATFSEPETLSRIVETLAPQAHAMVLWDLPALAAEGLSPQSQTTCVVEAGPLGAALEQLLDPNGLTIVPLDETSLLLTTKAAAARRQLTERYNLARVLEQRRWGLDEAAIVGALRQELAARRLQVAETVPMAWDRASRTLAVTASPLVHRALGEILNQAPQKPVAATTIIKK